jgi:hypothetical protein
LSNARAKFDKSVTWYNGEGPVLMAGRGWR